MNRYVVEFVNLRGKIMELQRPVMAVIAFVAVVAVVAIVAVKPL